MKIESEHVEMTGPHKIINTTEVIELSLAEEAPECDPYNTVKDLPILRLSDNDHTANKLLRGQ